LSRIRVFVNQKQTQKTTQTMIITHSPTQSNGKNSFSNKTAKQVINQTFDGIKKLFTKSSLDEIAFQVGFIKRNSSKIRGFDFLTSLLISSTSASHSSLARINDILAHVSRKTVVTSQAIMKRINNQYAVEFLKAVYSKILAKKFLILDEIPAEVLSFFSKILLQDSSTIVLNEQLQDHFKGSGGRASKASAKVWAPEIIGTVYRIRWQIELIFKCWKSRLEIHYLKGTNYHRILCLIYAKLILILLVNQIYRLVEYIERGKSNRIVSMPKVFAWMKDTERILKIIRGSMDSMEKQQFIKSIPRVMCMDVRKRKTSFERVCECEIFG
jgi:hypothetical protein